MCVNVGTTGTGIDTTMPDCSYITSSIIAFGTCQGPNEKIVEKMCKTFAHDCIWRHHAGSFTYEQYKSGG